MAGGEGDVNEGNGGEVPEIMQVGGMLMYGIGKCAYQSKWVKNNVKKHLGEIQNIGVSWFQCEDYR